MVVLGRVVQPNHRGRLQEPEPDTGDRTDVDGVVVEAGIVGPDNLGALAEHGHGPGLRDTPRERQGIDLRANENRKTGYA